MIEQLVEDLMKGEIMPTIYLGGPVTEFLKDTPSYAADWREKFPELVNAISPSLPFEFENPCEGMYDKSTLKFEVDESNSWRYTDQYIADRCLTQILNSDIILCNYLNSSGFDSLGTAWEVGFSLALKSKTIIIVDTPDGRVSTHPLIKLSSNFIAHDLYSAAQYAVYSATKQK